MNDACGDVIATDVKKMLDVDKGWLTPAIYADEAVFQQEMDRVFGRCWLFVAHESLIPEPGDFFASKMGIDPVLVVRQKDHSINVFLNQCRHRGSRVCRAEWGSTRSFRCTYHGWNYDLAGNLIGVPQEKQIFKDKLDKRQWGLVPVAKIENYHGLIFATWDEQAESFADYLGEVKPYYDAIFNRTEAGTEVIAGVQKWVVACNWKLAAEQFTSDVYHFNTTHVASTLALMPEGFEYAPLPPVQGRQFRDAHGHGGLFTPDMALADAQTAMGQGPEVLAYMQSRRAETTARLGKLWGEDSTCVHANMFPNFGILPLNQTIRLWQPLSAGKMEIWSWTLVDKDAPQAIKDNARLQTQFTFGTSGTFEQDDAENWAEVQRVLSSNRARRNRLNIEMGQGESQDPDSVFPGTTDFSVGEAAARSFYKYWQQLMMKPPAKG